MRDKDVSLIALAYALERVAHAVEIELKRVPGTREVQTLGGPGRALRVLLDADRLNADIDDFNGHILCGQGIAV